MLTRCFGGGQRCRIPVLKMQTYSGICGINRYSFPCLISMGAPVGRRQHVEVVHQQRDLCYRKATPQAPNPPASANRQVGPQGYGCHPICYGCRHGLLNGMFTCRRSCVVLTLSRSANEPRRHLMKHTRRCLYLLLSRRNHIRAYSGFHTKQYNQTPPPASTSAAGSERVCVRPAHHCHKLGQRQREKRGLLGACDLLPPLNLSALLNSG